MGVRLPWSEERLEEEGVKLPKMENVFKLLSVVIYKGKKVIKVVWF